MRLTMGRTCIERDPGRPPTIAARPRILHVTKVPPSNSGIARHALPFDRSLDLLGSRSTLGLPVDAGDTQRVALTVRTVVQAWRKVRRHAADLVVIDLSGRALAEFFVAMTLTFGGRRRTIWLVLHDPPVLVGPPLLFRFLDRRGRRRAGIALSNTIGGLLERRLVRDVDAVIAFSDLGAAAVREHFAVETWAVPLPTEILPQRKEAPIVYCPASLHPSDLAPILSVLATRPHSTVQLRVGYMPKCDCDEVLEICAALGFEGRLEFTGYLDQAELDESFSTAAIVVRHRPESEDSTNWAAASGPIVSALAAGCAVLSTDARGSRACVQAAGIDVSSAPSLLPETLDHVLKSPSDQRRLQEQAIAHVQSTHSPEAVARYLLQIWAETTRTRLSGTLPRRRMSPLRRD